MTELQEFKEAQIKALQKRVKELEQEVKWAKKSELETMNHFEAELKLENENKRSHVVGLQLQIEDLQEDNNKLVEVIKGLDPTNPILQHLTL